MKLRGMSCPSEGKDPDVPRVCDNRKAYLKETLIYHPDKNQGCVEHAGEKFKFLNAMCEAGADRPKLWENYNKEKAKWRQPPPQQAPPPQAPPQAPPQQRPPPSQAPPQQRSPPPPPPQQQPPPQAPPQQRPPQAPPQQPPPQAPPPQAPPQQRPPQAPPQQQQQPPPQQQQQPPPPQAPPQQQQQPPPQQQQQPPPQQPDQEQEQRWMLQWVELQNATKGTDEPVDVRERHKSIEWEMWKAKRLNDENTAKRIFFRRSGRGPGPYDNLNQQQKDELWNQNKGRLLQAEWEKYLDEASSAYYRKLGNFFSLVQLMYKFKRPNETLEERRGRWNLLSKEEQTHYLQDERIASEEECWNPYYRRILNERYSIEQQYDAWHGEKSSCFEKKLESLFKPYAEYEKYMFEHWDRWQNEFSDRKETREERIARWDNGERDRWYSQEEGKKEEYKRKWYEDRVHWSDLNLYRLSKEEQDAKWLSEKYAWYSYMWEFELREAIERKKWWANQKGEEWEKAEEWELYEQRKKRWWQLEQNKSVGYNERQDYWESHTDELLAYIKSLEAEERGKQEAEERGKQEAEERGKQEARAQPPPVQYPRGSVFQFGHVKSVPNTNPAVLTPEQERINEEWWQGQQQRRAEELAQREQLFWNWWNEMPENVRWKWLLYNTPSNTYKGPLPFMLATAPLLKPHVNAIIPLDKLRSMGWMKGGGHTTKKAKTRKRAKKVVIRKALGYKERNKQGSTHKRIKNRNGRNTRKHH